MPVPETSEDEVLRTLDNLYAEKDQHRVALERVQSKIDALSRTLSAHRQRQTDEFLHSEFDEKSIGFTTRLVLDEVRVTLFSQPGGEAEFEKLRSRLNWPSTTDIPLPHLIFYLGKGLPWGDNSSLPYEL